MSLVLLSQKASATDLILATVCVNAVCVKFLTTVVVSEEDGDTDLTHGLSHTALQCRSTAQAAIQRIPMLAPPSLALLQALLAGVSAACQMNHLTFVDEKFSDLSLSRFRGSQHVLGSDQGCLQSL